ncbi:MAG: TPM domain-containing protein [Terracidiphilus sp.]|jgi:uncharacterized protein|nr:TPM domain-containing protein [Terracidiphilus sp.]
MEGFRRAHSNLFPLLAAVLVVFFAATLAAQRVDDLPPPTDYVSDLAHVLSPEAIAHIDRVCTQLDHSQASAQISVVTVQTLAGEDAAEYSDQLETKWKMGRKGSDKGVLILLAVGDHQRRIEVGYGLEGILPDGKLGDIGREMVPNLRANDYDSAATQAVDEIGQVIAADARVTLDEQPAMQQPVPRRHPSGIGWIKVVVILIVVALYLFRVLGSWGLFGLWGLGLMSRGSGSGGGFGGFGGGDSGGGGFGGFGGGSFGGGGSGGSW